MKAEFINLGRNDINKTVEVKNTKALHREIQKHVISRNWDMMESETENIYDVFSGLRSIGQVKIIEP